MKPKKDKMDIYTGSTFPNTYEKATGKSYTENEVQYKWTGKSLTARQVIAESGMDVYEAARFIEWMKTNEISNLDWGVCGNYTSTSKSSKFLEYALKHPCFRDFLLAGGYIEKVEEEWVSPKCGDRFRLGEQKEEYILSQPDHNMIALICTGDGNRWSRFVEVKDRHNITKSEFQKICGSVPIDELERI